MFHRILKFLVSLSPGIRRTIFRLCYQLISIFCHKKGVIFINYGYAELDEKKQALELDEKDELNRYPIQLYHHIVSNVDLSGKHVLEVGSGPGGGSSFIMSYYKPKTMTGIDISSRAVKFCNEALQVPGLSFKQGDAENLPFSDERFDAVVNVESSHCYGSMDKFLSEVCRVLKPEGYFLFCDVRDKKDITLLDGSFKSSGLKIIRERNITENVLKALDRVTEEKEKIIRGHFPGWIVKLIFDTTGVKGGRIYKDLQNGGRVYISRILKK